MSEPVVYTTFDKEKRNELWHELRTRGRGAERQVVRFSGVEPVLTALGQDIRMIVYDRATGHARPATDSDPLRNVQFRPLWKSNWSVSHPAEIETLKGKVNGRTEASTEV